MSINYSAIGLSGPAIGASIATDARHFQIATLASLLVLHVTWFDLGATPLQAAIRVARQESVAFSIITPCISQTAQ